MHRRTTIYQGRANSNTMVNDRYLSFWWSILIVHQVICGKGTLQDGIFSAQQAYHTFNVDLHISYPSCSEIVKPLSAMTISPGTKNSKKPQFSVGYLSEVLGA